MAVLTAKGISALAIELLLRSIVLPRTVSLIPSNEFTGPNGGTVTVRVPQPGSSLIQETRSAALTAADVDEVPIDVTVKHIYHLKNVSDQELTLDLENFARQVTRVQVGAVATGAENELAGVMNALTADATLVEAGTDIETKILNAREFLGDNDCPADGRFLAVSPAVATFMLKLDKFSKVNESGASSALRDAILGRIYGFTVVESNALTAGTAVAYHRSGFAMANRTPAPARGATESAAASSQGIGLRQVFQYNAGTATDQSLITTFAGAAAVYENGTGTNGSTVKRFYKLDTEEASSAV